MDRELRGEGRCGRSTLSSALDWLWLALPAWHCTPRSVYASGWMTQGQHEVSPSGLVPHLLRSTCKGAPVIVLK
jgi:hypothetical protein